MKLQKNVLLTGGLLFLAVLLFGTSAHASIFDGTNVILDASSSGGQPAVRYGSDTYVTLHSTSTSITPCPGVTGLDPIRVPSTGTVDHWDLPRKTTYPNPGYWCFQSSASEHTVSWSWSGQIKWLPNNNNTGFYNVKDFGAAGDGSADDTAEIRNAFIYAAAKDGGRILFPRGIFKVTDTLTVPSKVTIQGTAGAGTSTFTNAYNPESPSQVYLTATNKAIFRIGENQEGIRFRDIELRASSTTGTYGVEAIGKLNTTYGGSTQFVSFENMEFTGFDKGIYVHMVDRDNGSWHFDYVKVDHCVFTYNKNAGVYIDVYNTDWAIRSSNFNLPPHITDGAEADAIRIRYGGAIQIENTFAGGVDYDDLSGKDPIYKQGGDFIDVTGVGSLTISNCAPERLTRGLVWAEGSGISGNLASMITVYGGGFGDPVELYQPVNYVSNGASYFGATVKAFNDDVRFYSTGDRFCYGSWVSNPCGNISTPPPSGEHIGFQGGKIMFQSGQLKDGSIPAIPATIGSDTQIVSDSSTTAAKPILNVTTPHVSGQSKVFLQLEQTTSGGAFNYTLQRNGTNGYLQFTGSQGTPWTGYMFNGPVQIPARTLSGITAENGVVGEGAIMVCTNCQANSSPCATGGSGALAIQIGGNWVCK